MRLHKVLCLALAAANLAVFALSARPPQAQGLRAVVTARGRESAREILPGRKLVFRSIDDPPDVPQAKVAPPAESAKQSGQDGVDRDSLAFLGQMKDTEGHPVYFFKDRRTNRIYSTGSTNASVQVISISETALLVTIDGVRYETLR